MSWDRREEDLFIFPGLAFPQLELPAPYPCSTWPSARPGLEARHAVSLPCWNCPSRRQLIFPLIILFLNVHSFCSKSFPFQESAWHPFLPPGAVPSWTPTTVGRVCCQWVNMMQFFPRVLVRTTLWLDALSTTSVILILHGQHSRATGQAAHIQPQGSVLLIATVHACMHAVCVRWGPGGTEMAIFWKFN